MLLCKLHYPALTKLPVLGKELGCECNYRPYFLWVERETFEMLHVSVSDHCLSEVSRSLELSHEASKWWVVGPQLVSARIHWNSLVPMQDCK